MADVVYRTPRDLLAAVAARAKNVAAEHPDATTAQLQAEFVHRRFLARVFTSPDGTWALKGGVALLARVVDARYSRDVDLHHTVGDLDRAVRSLRPVLAGDAHGRVWNPAVLAWQ